MRTVSAFSMQYEVRAHLPWWYNNHIVQRDSSCDHHHPPPVISIRGRSDVANLLMHTHTPTHMHQSCWCQVSAQYGEMTDVASVRRQGRSFYAGFIFGISQASMYFCYALLFWWVNHLTLHTSRNTARNGSRDIEQNVLLTFDAPTLSLFICIFYFVLVITSYDFYLALHS